jgi:hypothetical protein
MVKHLQISAFSACSAVNCLVRSGRMRVTTEITEITELRWSDILRSLWSPCSLW